MAAITNGIARGGQLIDATWTKKHGKSHYGYKLSINADNKDKLIRQIQTGTALTHDSQHFDDVLDPANTRRDVDADRGYPSEAREAWLTEKGWRCQIQRKGQRNKPLSACQQRRNRRIAKTRARAEHVFGSIELEISHRDAQDQAFAGQAYKIIFEGGQTLRGKLDANGFAHHDNVPPKALRVEYEARQPESEKPWEPLSQLTNAVKQTLG